MSIIATHWPDVLATWVVAPTIGTQINKIYHWTLTMKCISKSNVYLHFLDAYQFRILVDPQSCQKDGEDN